MPEYPSSVDRALKQVLGERPSVLNWIPESEHAAIRARSSTYDAGPTFEIALAEATAIGAAVVIPHGTLRVASSVSLPDGSVLIGDGGTIDLYDDGTASGVSLFLDSLSSARIEGLKITSSNASSRTGVYGNIRIQDSSNVTIRDCSISGGSSTGIHIINSSELLIQSNYISDTWADGIHVSRGSSNVRIIGNTLDHTGDDGIGLIGYLTDDGVLFYDPITGAVVLGNTIRNINKSVGRGIALYGVQHSTIQANTIDTVWDSGILVGATVGEVHGSSTHYNHDLCISGNTIKNAGVGTGPGAGTRCGIYLSYCRKVTGKGNIIQQAAQDGLAVAIVAKDVEVGAHISGAERGIILAPYSVTDSRMNQELFTDFSDSYSSSVPVQKVQLSGSVQTTANDGFVSDVHSSEHCADVTLDGLEIYDASGRAVLSQYCDHLLIKGGRYRNAAASTEAEVIRIGGGSSILIEGADITATKSGTTGVTTVGVSGALLIGNEVTRNTAIAVYADPTSSGVMCYSNSLTGTGDGVHDAILLDNATSYKFCNPGDDFGGGYGISGDTTGTLRAVDVGSVLASNLQVGTWLLGRSAQSAGGSRVGVGLNARFDGSNWIVKTDGGSNAGAVILVNYGNGNIDFFTVPSTGGTVQTISNAALAGYIRATITNTGKIALYGMATDQPVVTDGSKILTNSKISVTNASHVEVSGLTDGKLIKRSGSVLATDTTADAVISVFPLTANSVMKTNGSGYPGVCTYLDIYNNIKSLIEADFVTPTQLSTYTYVKADIDTMLSGKLSTSALPLSVSGTCEGTADLGTGAVTGTISGSAS